MTSIEPVKVEIFDFGMLEFFSYYVIGSIKSDVRVTTEIVKKMLSSIKNHYGNTRVVYISNRKLGHQIDISAYKLVDPKRLVAIAIVASNREEALVSASKEQAAYSGSFGVFDTLDSAISWAKSFVEEENDNED